MNLKEIKEMINLMNENDLTEIEVEREGSKIKMKKASSDAIPIISHAPAYQIPAQPAASGAPQVSEAQATSSNSNLKEIKSPMVGTFYRSASPEAASFVEVGDVVEIGQVVCIIEAMKLMNEIKSEVKGKIAEIPADNAQPVEFGQVLFGIEPL
jgi:acetyl-CoA carboxylase biotin carboxyl carrier protein